jgi:glutamate-1-semialdehyde 2,1-aminomutase
MNSSELFERSKRVSPGGVHSPVRGFTNLGRPPVFFKSGQGAILTSVEGETYIDYCQSFGPNILGHRDADVQRAVERAISEAWTFGAADPYSLEFAELLVEQLPFVDMLRFVNSGTEAVMSALRVARAVTKRDKVLKFEGCYHGHVDSMLVKAGSGLAGQSASSSAGVSEQTASTTLVVPLNDIEAFERVMKENAQEIAAVIIEPLPANYGLLIQDENYLKRIAEVTQANCSLLIFDEVISGFRVGISGMAGRLGIEPDLVTYGKILGGGFPVGCYGGKLGFMQQVAPLGPVYQAGTLSANPVAMRAGLATVEKCLKANVYETLDERAKWFTVELNTLFLKMEKSWKAIQYGSLFWIASSQVENYRSPDDIRKDHSEHFNPLFLKLLERGVYLAPNSFEVGFLSLAHSQEILQQTLDHFEQALQEIS